MMAAIDKQLKTLVSDGPDDKKRLAFKYLVHLVADVHQPLHAGYRDERVTSGRSSDDCGKGNDLDRP